MQSLLSRIPDRARLPLLGAGFFVVALATFGRSIGQGFAPIDDAFLIQGNVAIRGVTWDHLRLIFTTFDPELYIPLTLFTFQLNYMVSGLATELYHVANILLHAGNAFLVFLLLQRFTKQRVLSLLGGLLFLVHPLHTEAVVWLAGRKDLLSTLFVLLSLLLYVRYRSAQAQGLGLGLGWLIISVLTFLLALLSKVVAATVPAVLLLIDLLLERRPMNRWLWIDKIPYALLSGLFLWIATLGKERILASSTLLETALMAGKSTAFYLQKIFVPIHLSPFYPFRGDITVGDPQFLVPTLIVLGLVTAAVLLRKRASWFSFGILFFLITLGPTFFNFHKGSQMFFAVDRYAYLPSVGILFLVVMVVGIFSPTPNPFFASPPPSPNPFPRGGKGSVLSPSPSGGGARGGGMIQIGAVLTALILIPILSALSYQQSKIWDGAEPMLGHTLALYPESVTARTDLARILREQGRVQEAFDLLREGLVYGDDPALRIAAGLVYAAAGQVDEAEAQLWKVANRDPTNPDPPYYLGSIALQTGNPGRALRHFERAVALDPSYVAARVSLGRLYKERKRTDEALEQFEQAVSWNPSSLDARLELATLLEDLGRFSEAEEHWKVVEELTGLRPPEADYGRQEIEN